MKVLLRLNYEREHSEGLDMDSLINDDTLHLEALVLKECRFNDFLARSVPPRTNRMEELGEKGIFPDEKAVVEELVRTGRIINENVNTYDVHYYNPH